MKKINKITAQERDLIALLYARGIGIKKISRRLSKHHTSISREIKRNSFKGHYLSLHAQAKTNKRKSDAGKRHPLKNPDVFRFTIEHLVRGWSPEQISGKLKLNYPDDKHWHIHHETIYRFIYSEDQKHRLWWEYLPRKQKRRRKQTGRSSQRVRIPDRVSIHSRPKRANTREEFGHWEGDSVIGKRASLCL
jgi:IS30 family transposase